MKGGLRVDEGWIKGFPGAAPKGSQKVSCSPLTQDSNGFLCSTDGANATATAAVTATAAASATGTTLFAHGLLHENTLC